ncbi:MAG: hypothetical protein IT304_03090 [Dehalococcoidia bacterium]|nr:hypothetical protein [Dehalococcoidia bacterium]
MRSSSRSSSRRRLGAFRLVFPVAVLVLLLLPMGASGREADTGPSPAVGAAAEPQPGNVHIPAAAPVSPASFDGDVRTLTPVPNPVWSGWEGHISSSGKSGGGPPPRDNPAAPAIAYGPMPSTTVNFAGLSRTDVCTGGQCGSGWPPDINGDVGRNHYIEAVNSAYAIYDKTGTLLASFTENSLWATGGSNACNGNSQGDPIVLYDTLADRWILSHFAFAISGGNPVAPFYQCIAASKTSDPVAGGWWLYALRMDTGAVGQPPVNTLNDYGKFGLWNDGCLYFGGNGFLAPGFSFNGAQFANFNLADMYSGAALRWGLGVLAYPANNVASMFPANLRAIASSSLPPPNTPAYFVAESVTAYSWDVRKLTPAANCEGGTLSAATSVSQTSYPFPSSGESVTQPGTTNKLDNLMDRVMQKVQYRKVGSAESLWVTHTTYNSTDATHRPQWAQLNVTGGTISATPVQEQMFAPDTTKHRWMPSIAADNQGNVALGYSISDGTATYPSIGYAGRLAGDPLNQLPQTEVIMQAGSGSQTNNCGGAPCHRWGDYTAMSVDPIDDCTFWYTNQYYSSQANGTAGNWQTRIGAFKFPSCTAPADVPDHLAFSSAPAGGTVNVPLTPLVVQVQDATNGLVTADSFRQVTITKASGPGNLTCSPLTVVAGVAAFVSCSVDTAGTYTLTANGSPSLTGATTGSIVVSGAGPGTLQFAAASYDRLEYQAGKAKPIVQRVGGSSGAVSVTCTTGGGTASPGPDYAPTNVVLSWADGDTSNKECQVRVFDDSIPEATETITVGLSGPTGGETLGLASTTVNILDPKAAISSPTGNSTLGGSSQLFTRTAGSGVTQALLWFGNAPGASDIAGYDVTAGLTQLATALPTDGRTIYVRLWSAFAGGYWSYNDYSYAANGIAARTPATLVSPANLSTLTGATVSFLRTNGSDATEYLLWVGTAPRTADISGWTMNAPSLLVRGLPTNGSTVYITLWTGFSPGPYGVQDYVYTAVNGGAVKATITLPANGSTLGGASVTFTRDTGNRIVNYHLWVGSSAGAFDIRADYMVSASYLVNTMPTDGRTIYVRLWSEFDDGTFQYNDYTYTAFGP